MSLNLIDEEKIKDSYSLIGQEQIFRFWDDLNRTEKSILLDQLIKIDPLECQGAWEEINSSSSSACNPQPPNSISSTDPLDSMHESGEEMLAKGNAEGGVLIANARDAFIEGMVGACIVAGCVALIAAIIVKWKMPEDVSSTAEE